MQFFQLFSLYRITTKVLFTLTPLTKRHQLASRETTSTLNSTTVNVWAKSLAAGVDVCLCFKHTQRCSSMFLQKAAEQMKSQKHERLGWGGRLLAFHWALASHVVRVAVVHLQFPPWLREGVHCGRGGQWRAMVCLYMHLKVGRSGETWDQKNKEQGSCVTHSRPLTTRRGVLLHNDRRFDEDDPIDVWFDLTRITLEHKWLTEGKLNKYPSLWISSLNSKEHLGQEKCAAHSEEMFFMN